MKHFIALVLVGIAAALASSVAAMFELILVLPVTVVFCAALITWAVISERREALA